MSNTSIKHLVVERTERKPIPGTVYSAPVVTRTVVTEFTRHAYVPPQNTRCMTCSINYALKNDRWGFVRHQDNCIPPNVNLDEILCDQCDNPVFPTNWIDIDEQLPVRGNDYRFIICRDRDRYPTEEWREWRGFYVEHLWPQRKCDQHWSYRNNERLVELYDAWCEVEYDEALKRRFDDEVKRIHPEWA